MQRVTLSALEPAALHAVIVLGMPDGRLDRLTPLQPAPLAARERAALAAMDQCHPAKCQRRLKSDPFWASIAGVKLTPWARRVTRWSRPMPSPPSRLCACP